MLYVRSSSETYAGVSQSLLHSVWGYVSLTGVAAAYSA